MQSKMMESIASGKPLLEWSDVKYEICDLVVGDHSKMGKKSCKESYVHGTFGDLIH